jgi:SAM-dependent methyltransferase
VPPWTLLEHEARYAFGAGLVNGGFVIDCACGDGAGVEQYLTGRPDRLFACDVDKLAIAAARQRVSDRTVEFAVADACRLPLPDRCADLYISFETIEHVVDAGALLDEAARVLKPDGRFVCSTPDRNVTNPGTRQDDGPLCIAHVREFTPRELLGLLQSRFDRIAPYGQNEVGRLRRCALSAIRVVRPHRLAARLSQATKLTRFLIDSAEHHRVRRVVEGRTYDFVVAVCSGPKVPPRRSTSA